MNPTQRNKIRSLHDELTTLEKEIKVFEVLEKNLDLPAVQDIVRYADSTISVIKDNKESDRASKSFELNKLIEEEKKLFLDSILNRSNKFSRRPIEAIIQCLPEGVKIYKQQVYRKDVEDLIYYKFDSEVFKFKRLYQLPFDRGTLDFIKSPNELDGCVGVQQIYNDMFLIYNKNLDSFSYLKRF